MAPGPCATGKLKILLIANYALDRQKSMQRFVTMIASGLQQDHEISIIRPRAFLGRIPIPHIGFRKWFGYVDKYLLFPIELMVRIRRFDVVHICDQANAVYVWFLWGRPHLITCHDVLGLRSAIGHYTINPIGWTGRIYQKMIHSGLAKAMRVVCVSAATTDALVKLGRVPEDRISTIENGIDSTISPPPSDVAWARVTKFGLKCGEAFVLHVGGNEWYKNRLGLIRIYAALRSNVSTKIGSLVAVGPDWSTEQKQVINDLGLTHFVRAVNNVTETDLCALYSLAECLIFPSLDEGFGWPVAEAQACGCPVFASNRGPLISVGGGAAIYYDPDDSSAAASIISSSWRERERMRSEGFVNVARFSIRRMVDLYLAEYRSVYCK